MTTYREYETDPTRDVTCERGKWGRAWTRILASQRDLLVAYAKAAVQAGWIATADPEALAHHGRACGMVRGYFESVESYRARLLRRWDYRIWQGTKKGMVDSLSWAIAGAMRISPTACNIEVKENWDWIRGTFTGTANANDHRAFWVVIRHPHPFGTTAPLWGAAGAWGDGGRWGGGGGDGRIIDLIRTIAREQTPPHARLVQIIVVLSGDIESTTGEPLNDPATGHPYPVLYMSV